MKNIYYLFIICCLPFTLSAQCFPDRHNTSWTDAWVSCESSQNPNPNRGNGHWIAYDFESVYALGKMKMWNLNIPEELISGVQSFNVDYSVDGQNWTELGSYTLGMASGKSNYEGQDVTDWSGKQARFVIITPTSNYGGTCVGISEVRFGLQTNTEVVTSVRKTTAHFTVKTYPNPYTDRFTIDIDSKIDSEVEYSLTNILGQVVLQDSFNPSLSSRIEVVTNNLPAGNYVIKVVQDDGFIAKSMVQIPSR